MEAIEMKSTGIAGVSGLVLVAAAGSALAQPLVVPGDIVVGWSQFSSTPTNHFQRTIELFSASGVQKPDEWDDFLGIQSVSWDNSGGMSHNPMGRLIGVDFGATGVGFRMYAYESGNGWAGTPLFNDAAAMAPNFSWFGMTISRGGGVSVSPDNTRIAVAGSDSGQVYIFTYDASIPAITGGQQTFGLPVPLATGRTAGTAWLDSNTIVALSATGEFITVDANTADITSRITVPGAGLGGSEFTSVAYRSEVAPYIYAGYSNFGNNITTNTLYVVDPRTNPWTMVAQVDLSASANTMREISLSPTGDLIFTTHGNTTSIPQFPTIQRIAGVTTPALIANNSSQVIYNSTFTSTFNGVDVAGGTVTPSCYPNCDGSTTPPILNVADFGCFLTKFAAGDPYANCDNSTVPPVHNVADFGCFLTKFAAGCR
jgi:hypothetical protein